MALVNFWLCFQDEPKHDEGGVLTTLWVFNGAIGILTLNAILEWEIILLMALSLLICIIEAKSDGFGLRMVAGPSLLPMTLQWMMVMMPSLKSMSSWRNEMDSTLLWHGFGALEGNWCRLLWNGICVFTKSKYGYSTAWGSFSFFLFFFSFAIAKFSQIF